MAIIPISAKADEFHPMQTRPQAEPTSSELSALSSQRDLIIFATDFCREGYIGTSIDPNTCPCIAENFINTMEGNARLALQSLVMGQRSNDMNEIANAMNMPVAILTSFSHEKVAPAIFSAVTICYAQNDVSGLQ